MQIHTPLPNTRGAPRWFSPALLRSTRRAHGRSCWPGPGTKPKHGRVVRCSTDDAADWAKEMDTFRKRTMKPNQLATLRKMEKENVVTGKVIAQVGGVAIIEGLNNDAPSGTTINFEGGGKGVLLWRRSDNYCSALVLNGAKVEEGENAQCKVEGIIQVVDESTGPSTKREYEVLKVPAGQNLAGKVVDYMGVPLEGSKGSMSQDDASSRIPLLNEQADMQNREVISEPLVTGIKAIDVLTPVGRGQNLLILGPKNSGKTTVGLDIILGQKGTGVQCVYAATDADPQDIKKIESVLDKEGAMEYTTIVTGGGCRDDVGELYAVMCSATSIAEHVRDSGGHALVIVDSLKPMIDLWGQMSEALGITRPGLVDEGKEKEDDTDFDLVEYEGMLISATAAERRRFFGSFMQRAAKMKRALGGGTLSLLCILQGVPATGITNPELTIPGYETLSDEIKEKLLAKLRKNKEMEALPSTHPDDLPPEVVEEFMSISDGQVILKERSECKEGNSPGLINVQPAGSISRIGTRAYPSIMQTVASQIKFDLAQAEDARRFSVNADDPIVAKAERKAQQVLQALSQVPQQPVPKEEQVLGLLALNSGLMESIDPERIPSAIDSWVDFVKSTSPRLLSELEDAEMLTEAMKAKILRDCAYYMKK